MTDMKVAITFSGGPMEEVPALTDCLSKVKMFCCTERRHVYIYVHQGDGVYEFNIPASIAFTEKFDETVAKFGDDASVSFTDDDGEEGEIEWDISNEFRQAQDGSGYLPPSDWTPGSTDNEPGE